LNKKTSERKNELFDLVYILQNRTKHERKKDFFEIPMSNFFYGDQA